MAATKENTIFIMAGGFGREGIINEGYKVFKPYIEHNLLDRILREICFRYVFFPKEIWYNKNLRKESPEYVIISDPLITADYLKWIKKQFPDAQLIFTYGNMVGRAKHVLPDQVSEGYRIWTFDNGDSKKYNIRLYHTNAYYPNWVKPKLEPEYDVFFVGCDKGRGEYLTQLESKLREKGLKTKFIITADGRFKKRKSYYQKGIPYTEVINNIIRSKAILNVAIEGQQGMTIRDMESMFFGVKLITTNPNTVNMDFYHPENVYILKGMEIEGIPDFLEDDVVDVSEEIKRRHTLDKYIEEITQSY